MLEIGEEYAGEIFSSVVIDGNNAITVGTKAVDGKKHYEFSLERLHKTINAVEELGWKTFTVLKEGTYSNCMKSTSTLTDSQRSVLETMNLTKMVHIIGHNKDKDVDDKIMIEYALKYDAWILTGDTFRKDHIPKLMQEKRYDTINEINKRRVNLSFGPDHKPLFCLPQNLDALTATKVVSDTLNVELELLSGGCPIRISVSGEEEFLGLIPMRRPVGRKELLEIGKSKKMKEYLNAVSRNHFKFDWDGNDFYYTDLNSTNGTKINGMKIPPHQPQKLNQDDIVSISAVAITLA